MAEVEMGSPDLESGVEEKKAERDCRICQVGFDDCGPPILLGCSCKGDLASAHQHCADTWFKIKGDTTCEICGMTAVNVATNERTSEAAAAAAAPAVIVVETVWHGRRIMNFLLACMVLAFITSWLFHFKIL